MSEPFLAEIRLFGFNFAPRGWALCDGQVLPISQNQALYSLLGTTYGGDGRVTFALPDLRGRTSMHFGQGPGLSDYSLGQRSGEEAATVAIASLGPHSHTVNAAATADTTQPGGSVPAPVASAAPSGYAAAGDGTTMHAAMLANTGGGQAHENMQPYLVLNWCIALQGIFPSRS